MYFDDLFDDLFIAFELNWKRFFSFGYTSYDSRGKIRKGNKKLISNNVRNNQLIPYRLL